MSKGMVYTMFALTAATIIAMMVLLPFQGMDLGTEGEASMIGQASYYQDKTLRDAERAQSIAFNRALSEAINYVISAGDPLQNPEEDLESILVDGRIEGTELAYMQNASMKTWFGRVQNISEETSYEVNFSTEAVEFSKSDEFTMTSEMTVRSYLYDPRTLAKFNRSVEVETTSSIAGLEDPMLRVQTADTYGHFFSRCGFEAPAELMYDATGSGSTIHGYAVVEPDAATYTPDETDVIVTSDISGYDPGYTGEFAGAVSATDVANPSQYSDNYVVGTGSIAGIEDDDSLILHGGEVWDSRFRYMMNDGCYMVSDGDMNGPDFYDRLANRLTGSGDSGLVSLVNKSQISGGDDTSSNVDYVFFNESSGYGTTHEIAGVTSGDGSANYLEDFRIDNYHVEEWDIESLVE